MMRGMTADEYIEVMQYMQDNCSLFKKNNTVTPPIKYVDSCYDTRSRTWWSIDFRTWGAMSIGLRTNCFLSSDKETAPYGSLYEWCMAFLKGEWEATDRFHKRQ